MYYYITKKNDQLDKICYEFYRRVDILEEIIKANPHIDGLYTAKMDAGIKIRLPEITTLRKEKTINIWD